MVGGVGVRWSVGFSWRRLEIKRECSFQELMIEFHSIPIQSNPIHSIPFHVLPNAHTLMAIQGFTAIL